MEIHMMGRAYDSAVRNTNEKRIIEADFIMNEPAYDRIEGQDPSGVKVLMEFPRNSKIDGEKILQEVRELLSGALREFMGKVSGNV